MEELLAIFCDADDFCKDYESYCQHHLLMDKDKITPKTSMSLSEIMTIVIYFSFVKSKNIQMVLHQICRHCIKTVFSQAGQLQSLCGNYENVNSSVNIIPHEVPCWQVYGNKFY